MTRESALARRETARDRLVLVTGMVGPSPDPTILRTALPELDDIVRSDPSYAEAMWHLATAFESLGEYEEARSCYARTLRLDPEMSGDEDAAAQVYGRLAQLHEMAGEPAEAIRWYNRFLGYYPLSPHAPALAARVDLLGVCGGEWFANLRAGAQAMRAERREEAVEAFRRAIRDNPEAASLHRLLAISLREVGRYDEALAELETAGGLDNDARLYLEMGITYGDLGNPYVEEGFYGRTLELSPNDALALFNMGQALYGRRDRGQALQYLEKAIDLSPEAPWADKASEMIADLAKSGVLSLPDCLREPVAWQTWRSELDGLSVQYPGGAVVLSDLKPGDLLAFANDRERSVFEVRLRSWEADDGVEFESHVRVFEYRLKQDLDRKIESSDRIRSANYVVHVFDVRHHPTDTMDIVGLFSREDTIFELRCRIAWVVYVRTRDVFGYMLRSLQIQPPQNVYLARKKHWELQLARNPKDIEALTELGAAQVHLGNIEEAQHIYTRLLQLDRRNPRALGDLGLFYWQQDKLDLAIQALTKTLEERPDPRYSKYLGLCYERKGQPDKAARAYLDGLTGAPSRNLRTLLAVAYESMRKHDLAEKEYNQLLLEDPHDLRVRLLLAGLYRRTKRLPEATNAYRDAVQIDSRNVDANLMLAQCYYDTRYWDLAEKAFRKVQTLDPLNQAAQHGLQTLAVEKKKGRKY